MFDNYIVKNPYHKSFPFAQYFLLFIETNYFVRVSGLCNIHLDKGFYKYFVPPMFINLGISLYGVDRTITITTDDFIWKRISLLHYVSSFGPQFFI